MALAEQRVQWARLQEARPKLVSLSATVLRERLKYAGAWWRYTGAAVRWRRQLAREPLRARGCVRGRKLVLRKHSL